MINIHFHSFNLSIRPFVHSSIRPFVHSSIRPIAKTLSTLKLVHSLKLRFWPTNLSKRKVLLGIAILRCCFACKGVVETAEEVKKQEDEEEEIGGEETETK